MIMISYTEDDRTHLLDEMNMEYSEELMNRALSKEIPSKYLWGGKTIKEALNKNPHSPVPVSWYSGVMVQHGEYFQPEDKEGERFMMACRYILKYIDKVL